MLLPNLSQVCESWWNGHIIDKPAGYNYVAIMISYVCVCCVTD